MWRFDLASRTDGESQVVAGALWRESGARRQGSAPALSPGAPCRSGGALRDVGGAAVRPRNGFTWPFRGGRGFSVHLVAILLELVVAPLFAGTLAGLAIAQIIGAIVLLGALASTRVHGVGVALMLPAVLSILVEAVTPGTVRVEFIVGSRFTFLCYTTALIIRHILREREVTADTIAGAACAYLLIAMAWACVYTLLELRHPGSFSMPQGFAVSPEHEGIAALVLLSVGTLTTVGSTIQPTTLAAGGLCAAEAVVGQLYMAVMISRLVAMEL